MEINIPDITNVEKICRSCLQINDDMRSIFSSEEVYDKSCTISEMLMCCTNVQIREGDGLPLSLCLPCIHQLNKSYAFKLQCETSDTNLRAFVMKNGIKFVNVDIKIENNDISKENFVDSENTYEEIDPVSMCRVEVSNDITPNIENEDIDVDKKQKSFNLKQYTCDVCDKTFNSRGGLRYHKYIHMENKNFNCETCGKGCNTKSDLKKHLRTHSGEKPFVCEECNKTFARKENLKIHMRIHTGDKPYLCSVCSKRFTSRTNLNEHMRVHTGIRPHQCSVCGKGCNSTSDLKKHLRIHSDERPFVCEECNKSFARREYLKAHMRYHSDVKPL